MAVHKIDNSADVINGGSVICPGAGGYTYAHDDASRLQHWTNTDSLTTVAKEAGRYRHDYWSDEFEVIPQSVADRSSASGSVAASVLYEALPYRKHEISKVNYSYSAIPGTGYLQIESPSGTIVWGPQYITDKGPGFFDVTEFETKIGDSLFVYLSPGGLGSQNSLSIDGHRVV